MKTQASPPQRSDSLTGEGMRLYNLLEWPSVAEITSLPVEAADFLSGVNSQTSKLINNQSLISRWIVAEYLSGCEAE